MVVLMRLCALVVNVLCLPLHVIHALGLYKLYKRVFPSYMFRITIEYNKIMLDRKKQLFRHLPQFSGSGGRLAILEIGCGSGANFEFYPPGSKVICTDPNPHFHKYLKKCMEQNEQLTYDRFVVASGEDLGSVEDESVDAVVCTLVLCSVRSVPQTLREALRVLRPGEPSFSWSTLWGSPRRGRTSSSTCSSLCGSTSLMDVKPPGRHGNTWRLLGSLSSN